MNRTKLAFNKESALWSILYFYELYQIFIAACRVQTAKQRKKVYGTIFIKMKGRSHRPTIGKAAKTCKDIDCCGSDYRHIGKNTFPRYETQALWLFVRS